MTTRPPTPEPDNFSELITQWKEIDMPALNLAVDTGRKHNHARALVWMMRAMFAALCASLLAETVHGAQAGEFPTASVGILLLGTLGFIPLLRWQSRAMRRVEDALADGRPAQVLEARLQLINHAVCDVTSPVANRVMVGSVVLAVGWAGWMVATGDSLFLPALTLAALVGVWAWGRLVRLPRLLQERDAVLAIQRELEA